MLYCVCVLYFLKYELWIKLRIRFIFLPGGGRAGRGMSMESIHFPLAARCFSGFSTLCVLFMCSINSVRYQKLERHMVHVKSSSSSSLNNGLLVTLLRAAAAAAAAACAFILASACCSAAAAAAAIFFLLCGGTRVLPVRRPRVVTILPSSLRTTPPGPMRTMRVVPDLRKEAGSFLASAALAFAYA